MWLIQIITVTELLDCLVTVSITNNMLERALNAALYGIS